MTVSANSSTSAGGLASAATGIRPIRRGASHERAAMSSRNSCATRGRCTFTTTSSPVRRPGGVHLGDRGRRDGGLVEPLEQLLERAAEVDLDDGPHVVERLRRHLVAQELELRDQLVGEQPSPPEMIWPSLT